MSTEAEDLGERIAERATASAHGVASAGEAPRGEFSRADAIVAMAQSVVRGDAPRRSPFELVVTVAAEVLCGVPAGTSRSVAFGASEVPGGVPAGTSRSVAFGASEVPGGVPAGTSEVSAPFAVFADGTCVSAETARRLAWRRQWTT